MTPFDEAIVAIPQWVRALLGLGLGGAAVLVVLLTRGEVTR